MHRRVSALNNVWEFQNFSKRLLFLTFSHSERPQQSGLWAQVLFNPHQKLLLTAIRIKTTPQFFLLPAVACIAFTKCARDLNLPTSLDNFLLGRLPDTFT